MDRETDCLWNPCRLKDLKILAENGAPGPSTWLRARACQWLAMSEPAFMVLATGESNGGARQGSCPLAASEPRQLLNFDL